PVTASARKVPALMPGCAPGSDAHINGTVPARIAWMAGPAPGYGTCVMLMPAVIFSNSAARGGVVPMPALAELSSSGVALGRATISPIEVMPEAGVAMNTLGEVSSSATGAKSLNGSYGTCLYSPGLTTKALDTTSSV